MADWAQLFLESDPGDIAIANAVARALEQVPTQVRFVEGPSVQSLVAWRDASIQSVIVRDVMLDRTDARFPVLMEIRTRDRVAFSEHQMQDIGAALEIPFVTNVGGTEDGYRWSLVLPSREVRAIRLGDDDDFVLTPDDVAAIERDRSHARRAA